MNVLYSCCIADPFVDVANKLMLDYNMNPVYWIGDINSAKYKSEDPHYIKSTFPNVEYQAYFDAWHGVFPKCVEEKASSSYISIDFLRHFSSQELQALSMMDRLDYDRYSFSYLERERYYLCLIKKWMACIDLFNIDIVISANNPHRVFDYVLYLVCQSRNIKFVSFQFSLDAGRIYPVVDFSNNKALANIIDKDYKDILNKNISINDLPEDIINCYQKLTKDYKTARPSYMAEHDIDDVKNKNFFYLGKRFVRNHSLLGENSLFKGQKMTIYKNRDYCLENTRFSLWQWSSKRIKVLRYSKELLNYYKSITSEIDLNCDYIIFFLHYQPEETTSPTGDIFANQFICIETILKNTPDSVYIYIKEHPNQFMSHMQGHTKRIKEFYYDLIKNPRVRFVPFEMDSFTLMTNALAVSTITGTVGWEAAVRKKPVVIFGLVWYERMKGVLRVIDDNTASQIYNFIISYKYDEQSVLSYLYAFSKHSILAYHYQGYKEKYSYSHDETVNLLTTSIKKIISEH